MRACLLLSRKIRVVELGPVLLLREIVLYSERMNEYIQMIDITSLGSLLPSKANHT